MNARLSNYWLPQKENCVVSKISQQCNFQTWGCAVNLLFKISFLSKFYKTKRWFPYKVNYCFKKDTSTWNFSLPQRTGRRSGTLRSLLCSNSVGKTCDESCLCPSFVRDKKRSRKPENCQLKTALWEINGSFICWISISMLPNGDPKNIGF